ncbi:MAG TPA: hypothetical protein VJW76_09105 [Verrucomicrobiae bacterium]|nr:hypothetical protein [Verrucomicrobiae bacterium]
MIARLNKLVVVLMLTLTLGLHWAFLQSVAWVGMFVSFSAESPVSVALAKTFDGQHPCNLCKIVKEGKKAEQQQDTPKLLAKLDLILVCNPVRLGSPELAPLEILSAPSAVSGSWTPPSPPPRAA